MNLFKTRKGLTRLILALIFSSLLPVFAMAEAPVVDESENYAMLDEQQDASTRPRAQEHYDNKYQEDEIPLAKNDVQDDSEKFGLLDKIKGLQQEIQELRGQLEMQAHSLKKIQEQQLAFYKDLDARLANNKGKASAVNVPAHIDIKPRAENTFSEKTTTVAVQNPTASGAHANPAQEQMRYLAAFDLVKNKQFDDALVAMQDFVTKYPQGGYAANAQYWLGELYMVKKNYAQAITHFEAVIQQFPSSSKAAASSLKIAYALADSGKESEAKRRLEQVIKNYPDTPTAQLAATKLQSLKHT